MILAGRYLATALAAVGVAGVAVGGSRASGAGRGAPPPAARILLASDRDGTARVYSLRSDGSRLAPLFRRGRHLVPAAESADGRTLAYSLDSGAILVSRADGTRVWQIAREDYASGLALSRDGKQLAYHTSRPSAIWIVATDGSGRRRLTSGFADDFPDWSPDGTAVAFNRTVDWGKDQYELVVQPLSGSPRVLARGALGTDVQWSPDGRWIAYESDTGDPRYDEVWVVRPSGDDAHRVLAAGGDFKWSPDSTRIAYVNGPTVSTVGLDGRTSTLLRTPLWVGGLAWSPDGRRLALDVGDDQIWSIGADGRGLRRLTSRGHNVLVGWTTLAPILPPSRPIPATDRVVQGQTIVSRARIREIAADGARVAFIAGGTPVDCVHVAVWTPSTRSVRRLTGLPAPCEEYRDATSGLALAGTRAAWVETGSGEPLPTQVMSASLARPAPQGIAEAESDAETGAGGRIGRVVGHEGALAYTIVTTCDSAQGAEPGTACPNGSGQHVVETTAWLFGRRRPVVTEPGSLELLAVGAGGVVVGTDRQVRLVAPNGRVLHRFQHADAAALSGRRLALEGSEGISVYDTVSGRRVDHIAASDALVDLEGGILMTDSGGRMRLRRIADGRTIGIDVPDDAQAQLERSGLFVASAHRITFTPMRELLQRLGGRRGA